MKTTVSGKWALVVGVALLCFAPYVVAQQTQQLELTGVNGNNYAGIYIGPYDIQVGGSSGPTSGMICDDFNDDINIGSTWQATPYSVSGSNLKYTLFGSASGLTAYEEAAALSYAILFGNGSATTNALMQYAVWAIFSPGAVQSWLQGHDSNYAADWVTIQGWITWASQHSSQSLLSEFVVWTPYGCQSGGCGGQEFFQYVPEGGTALMYLLLAGTFCFGAMWIRSRRAAGILQA
ncbi:MAG: hypothetical protein ABSG02_08090 [Terriglobales bacterium]